MATHSDVFSRNFHIEFISLNIIIALIEMCRQNETLSHYGSTFQNNQTLKNTPPSDIHNIPCC